MQHEFDMQSQALDDLVSKLEEALNDTAKTIADTFIEYATILNNTIAAGVNVDTNKYLSDIYNLLMHPETVSEGQLEQAHSDYDDITNTLAYAQQYDSIVKDDNYKAYLEALDEYSSVKELIEKYEQDIKHEQFLINFYKKHPAYMNSDYDFIGASEKRIASIQSMIDELNPTKDSLWNEVLAAEEKYNQPGIYDELLNIHDSWGSFMNTWQDEVSDEARHLIDMVNNGEEYSARLTELLAAYNDLDDDILIAKEDYTQSLDVLREGNTEYYDRASENLDNVLETQGDIVREISSIYRMVFGESADIKQVWSGVYEGIEEAINKVLAEVSSITALSSSTVDAITTGNEAIPIEEKATKMVAEYIPATLDNLIENGVNAKVAERIIESATNDYSQVINDGFESLNTSINSLYNALNTDDILKTVNKISDSMDVKLSDIVKAINDKDFLEGYTISAASQKSDKSSASQTFDELRRAGFLVTYH